MNAGTIINAQESYFLTEDLNVSPNHIVNVAQGGALVPLYFGR